MRFEWDENKNRSNRKKHGVGFETAKLVFDDPLHISIQDRFENGEKRWRTVGLAGGPHHPGRGRRRSGENYFSPQGDQA